MTNKEAIEINKNLKEYMRILDKTSEHKFLEDNYIALEMGIKALERIDKLQSAYQRVLSAKSYDDVKDLEPEDLLVGLMGVLGIQEPCKVGHWINITDKKLNDYRTGNKLCFECSECKTKSTYSYTYCPMCGCRMESEE